VTPIHGAHIGGDDMGYYRVRDLRPLRVCCRARPIVVVLSIHRRCSRRRNIPWASSVRSLGALSSPPKEKCSGSLQGRRAVEVGVTPLGISVTPIGIKREVAGIRSVQRRCYPSRLRLKRIGYTGIGLTPIGVSDTGGN